MMASISGASKSSHGQATLFQTWGYSGNVNPRSTEVPELSKNKHTIGYKKTKGSYNQIERRKYGPTTENDFDNVLECLENDDDADLCEAVKQVDRSTHLDNNHISNCPPEILSGFDESSGHNYIYPINYPVRDYQFKIIMKALMKNTLVVLPTGLGKTFIAAVVMYNFYRWYPQGKILFMAPTKPLVAQQIQACYSITGTPAEDTAEMTGAMPPTKRKLMWETKRVFFLTPHVLQNDLGRGTCFAKDIVCLVFDEAHKALGNYAYCQVIKEVAGCKSDFRVLALSATPGSDLSAVQQVVTNLMISHVELRNEESADIKPYTFGRNVEKIVVPLSDELKKAKSEYIKVLEGIIQRLCSQGVCWQYDATKISKFFLLKARDTFRARGMEDKARVGMIESDFALAISLYHAYELLQQHGILSFYNFLKEVYCGTKGTARCRSELTRHEKFMEMMTDLQQRIEPPDDVDGSLNGSFLESLTPKRRLLKSIPKPNSLVASHPKLQKLEEIVVKHFEAAKENLPDASSQTPLSTRIMIFSQYRDSVQEITAVLSKHQPLVKVMSFVGQNASGKGKRGLSQKEQLEVVERFRKGGYNVLVSTSVGEEGLDIGEVDLIICFDASNSPIRLVQRMGRTGRKRAGKIIILVTEGKEDQVYKRSLTNKKSIHKKLADATNSLVLYDENPRMIPKHLNPCCLKMHITVEAKPSASRGVKRKSTDNKQRKVARKKLDNSATIHEGNSYAENDEEAGKKTLDATEEKIPENVTRKKDIPKKKGKRSDIQVKEVGEKPSGKNTSKKKVSRQKKLDKAKAWRRSTLNSEGNNVSDDENDDDFCYVDDLVVENNIEQRNEKSSRLNKETLNSELNSPRRDGSICEIVNPPVHEMSIKSPEQNQMKPCASNSPLKGTVSTDARLKTELLDFQLRSNREDICKEGILLDEEDRETFSQNILAFLPSSAPRGNFTSVRPHELCMRLKGTEEAVPPPPDCADLSSLLDDIVNEKTANIEDLNNIECRDGDSNNGETQSDSPPGFENSKRGKLAKAYIAENDTYFDENVDHFETRGKFECNPSDIEEIDLSTSCLFGDSLLIDADIIQDCPSPPVVAQRKSTFEDKAPGSPKNVLDSLSPCVSSSMRQNTERSTKREKIPYCNRKNISFSDKEDSFLGPTKTKTLSRRQSLQGFEMDFDMLPIQSLDDDNKKPPVSPIATHFRNRDVPKLDILESKHTELYDDQQELDYKANLTENILSDCDGLQSGDNVSPQSNRLIECDNVDKLAKANPESSGCSENDNEMPVASLATRLKKRGIKLEHRKMECGTNTRYSAMTESICDSGEKLDIRTICLEKEAYFRGCQKLSDSKLKPMSSLGHNADIQNTTRIRKDEGMMAINGKHVTFSSCKELLSSQKFSDGHAKVEEEASTHGSPLRINQKRRKKNRRIVDNSSGSENETLQPSPVDADSDDEIMILKRKRKKSKARALASPLVQNKDPDSDDDFDNSSSARKSLERNTFQERIGSDKLAKASARKIRRKRSEFVDDEVEVTDDDGCDDVESDHNEYVADSFIDDATQITQKTPIRSRRGDHDRVDMAMIYRQSLFSPMYGALNFRTPAFRANGNRYKMIHRNDWYKPSDDDDEAEEVNDFIDDETDFEEQQEMSDDSLALTPDDTAKNRSRQTDSSCERQPTRKTRIKRIIESDDSIDNCNGHAKEGGAVIEHVIVPDRGVRDEIGSPLNFKYDRPLTVDKRGRFETNPEHSNELIEDKSVSAGQRLNDWKLMNAFDNGKTLPKLEQDFLVPCFDFGLDIGSLGLRKSGVSSMEKDSTDEKCPRTGMNVENGSPSTTKNNQKASDQQRPCIFVHTKIVTSSQIGSHLRLKHQVQVKVCSNLGCDFVISKRMGVLRRLLSDITHPNKNLAAINELCEQYNKRIIVIEKDRVKGGSTNERHLSYTRCYTGLLGHLVESQIKILFTDSQEETAALISQLARKENETIYRLTHSTTDLLGYDLEPLLKVLLTLPQIKYPLAVRICNEFKCLKSLVQSKAEDIKVRIPEISTHRATDILHYFQNKFSK